MNSDVAVRQSSPWVGEGNIRNTSVVDVTDTGGLLGGLYALGSGGVARGAGSTIRWVCVLDSGIAAHQAPAAFPLYAQSLDTLSDEAPKPPAVHCQINESPKIPSTALRDVVASVGNVANDSTAAVPEVGDRSCVSGVVSGLNQ